MTKAETHQQADRLRELGTAPVGKLLFKYSLPAVVGTVVSAVYKIIDSIVIGHAIDDPNVVAGMAITFPVMNIVTAIGMLVGAGAATRVSIVMGQNDRRVAEIILGNCVQLTVIFGIMYVLGLSIFIDPILRAFGASDKSLPYAREFMLWVLPGMVLMNMTFSYNNVMRASGYPAKAMYTNMIGALLNACLAPLFLFVFKWGIRGAAIATDISMLVTATWVMSHFFNRRNTLHFTRGTFRFNWPVIRGVLYIGMAPFLINVAGSGVNAIINNTLMHYGGENPDNAVAAVVVFNRYVTIFVFVIIGICQGMQPIVGYNYGPLQQALPDVPHRRRGRRARLDYRHAGRSVRPASHRRHVHAGRTADPERRQLPAHHAGVVLDRRLPDRDHPILPGPRHGRQGRVPLPDPADHLHDTPAVHTAPHHGAQRRVDSVPHQRHRGHRRGGMPAVGADTEHQAPRPGARASDRGADRT